ncbi:MAG: MerR family transcriptional regulator [Solirubrobacteraceae bacterium]
MPAQLTIEQLAAESGMSVRNIRAHQARGLLDPPEVRLRVGYYGPDHVAQLKMIRDLQADGFNLAGIKRLLDDGQRTAERLARFRRALTAPADAERPQTLSAVDAVAERVVAWGVSLDGALGLLERIEEHCDAVSAAFVSLFMSEVWEPFLSAGMPEARWQEIDDSIAALRPLATDALLAIFFQRMSAQIEAAVAGLGRRPGRRDPIGSRM